MSHSFYLRDYVAKTHIDFAGRCRTANVEICEKTRSCEFPPGCPALIHLAPQSFQKRVVPRQQKPQHRMFQFR